MASDTGSKKTGTIFMGNREASVEQLNAMQEPVLKKKLQKEQAEDYMARVRIRAEDRAREILGAAYAERNKILEETRMEIMAQKRQAAEDCARLKGEGETARHLGQSELDKARAEREAAENIRAHAHEEGLQSGLEQAEAETGELRAELVRSLAAVLHALERERKKILAKWREDIAELTQCAIQAGTGYILEKEHQQILRSLVFQALDMLEKHASVTVFVNPADEAAVSDMFATARSRFPDLKQWIVTGDEGIEPGGLSVDGGSGSVDLKRANFRQLVEGILCHLALPDQESDAPEAMELRNLVEQEVARIASMTPEEEPPVREASQPQDIRPEFVEPEISQPNPSSAAEVVSPDDRQDGAPHDETDIPQEEEAAADNGEAPVELEENAEDVVQPAENEAAQNSAPDPSLAELEDELFPLEDQPETPEEKPKPEPPNPKTLAEGGFL